MNLSDMLLNKPAPYQVSDVAKQQERDARKQLRKKKERDADIKISQQHEIDLRKRIADALTNVPQTLAHLSRLTGISEYKIKRRINDIGELVPKRAGYYDRWKAKP